MPDQTPDFIPHTPDTAASAPDFIPHTSAPAAPASAMSSGKEGPQAGSPAAPPQTMMDKLSDYWGKLTSSYDPGAANSNPLVRGLSAVGGAALSVPQQTYQAVRHPIDTAKAMGSQVAGATKAWADPTTRPTWEGVKSVLPEALGQGVGQVAGGEVGGAALGATADFMRFASDPVVRKTFGELDNAGKQHAAIMQGKVKTVNDLVRNPASRFQDAVMGEQGEVGQHANAVLAADEADMRLKGSSAGMADATAGVQAARDTLKQNMGTEFGSGPIEGLLQRATGPQSMRNLKALRTQVGKVASQMYRGGNKGEAAALYTLYDGLSDAGNTRAAELGPQASSSWNHYSDVTAQFKDMEKGVLGEMLDPANHTTDTAKSNLLKHVVDNPTGLAEVTRSMKKYGVDPAPLNKAVEIGRGLQVASERTGNIVMGKIKAMIKHPLAVGVPAVAGSMAGSSLGLGGGIAGFVIPIAIAYHINGLLDRIQLTKILKDVSKRADDTSVTGELPDRQPVPPPPAASTTPSTTPPSAGGPSGFTTGSPLPQGSANPAATVGGGGYFGPERRVQEGGALVSGERRVAPGTPAGSAGPIKLAKTPGEELAEQIRTTRAGAKTGSTTEGEALQAIMKDPAKYAAYKQAEPKVRDVMLIKAKRELEGARK
jgi:hypothetical protein